MEQRTVLFVDDDVIVLQSLERGLMDESYNKYFASSCKDALEIIQREVVHVLVTDMIMPDMTGIELLREARKVHPDIVCIALSGYENDKEVKNAVDQGEIFTLMKKPWKLNSAGFEKTIRLALEQFEVDDHNEQGKLGKLEQYKTKLKKLIKLANDN